MDDQDEWDPSLGSFAQHAVAGSVAGLAEHLVMFPIDTAKTILQAGHVQRLQTSGAAAEVGAIPMLARLVNAQGAARMWSGVQTMMLACVPAHAAYFSIYEGMKPRLQKGGIVSDSVGAA